MYLSLRYRLECMTHIQVSSAGMKDWSRWSSLARVETQSRCFRTGVYECLEGGVDMILAEYLQVYVSFS